MKTLAIFSALLFLFACTSLYAANANTAPDPSTSNQQQIEEQLKELGEELHHKLTESIRRMLSGEILRLRTGRNAVDEATQNQIGNLDIIVKKDPGNAHAHFKLGELHDQMGDGANAILHTHEAEKLFIKNKNIKGMAEARRELRHYYNKYDFKKKDFELSD